MNPDYSDIRFTDLDNTLLPYWIESHDASSAIVWVKVHTIPTTGSQIYLYYGNPGAESLSNGYATFPFFDDFDGSSVNSTRWTSRIGTGASISIADSIATFTSGSGVGNVQAALESKADFRDRLHPRRQAAIRYYGG